MLEKLGFGFNNGLLLFCGAYFFAIGLKEKSKKLLKCNRVI